MTDHERLRLSVCTAAEPAGTVPLDAVDQAAVRALDSVTYLPASFNKRFARDIQACLAKPEPTLTAKQYRLVWAFCWRYRRQIRDAVVLAVARKIKVAMDGAAKPLYTTMNTSPLAAVETGTWKQAEPLPLFEPKGQEP